MSRSYKHTPYVGDKKSKFFKNYANRKLRRNKLNHNLQYKAYRKNFCSYDICDFYWRFNNFEDYYRWRLKHHYDGLWGFHDYGPPPSRKECWKDYVKYYTRK